MLSRGIGGELVRPALLEVEDVFEPSAEPPAVVLPARRFSTDFTTAFVDLRQYSPVGRGSWLDLRVVAGGNLAETPLPPQLQHALGGVGTLPVYSFQFANCEAQSGLGLYFARPLNDDVERDWRFVLRLDRRF